MNALAFTETTTRISGKQKHSSKRLLAKLQIVGVAIGLAGGVASGIFGATLMAAGWLAGNEAARHWLSSAGSTLLLLTIPLIIFGAFCLDWLEKNRD
ncbi:MAG: hypothetical protein SF097_03070 [Acidobacteriota bacterium]|nr:hypothetical protein [Acidobacteriota bacterium]